MCTGCQAQISHVRPALTNDGEVLLYMEPLPPEARDFRFNIDAVAAMRNDGVDLPLDIHIAEIRGSESARQRLLASAVLPPGEYRGISIKFHQAFQKTVSEEKALPVSDQPDKIAFPFTIKEKKGTVISLTLSLKEAMQEGAIFRPAYSAAIPNSPLTNLCGYVSNYGSNNVTVFDKREGTVRKVIETGQGPTGLALDQKNLRAYVAISGEDIIEVIDVLSNDIINTIRLTYGDHPGEIALTSDGTTLLVVNPGNNSISFVDPLSLIVLSRLTVGNEPNSILIDPTGKLAFVFNSISNNINVVNIASRTIVATITSEAGPLHGTFNRQGNEFLAIYEWSPNLVVFDLTTLAIQKRVYVGMGNYNIAVDTLTDLIYISKKFDPMVHIYDPFSLIQSDFLNAAGGAGYMLFDGDTRNMLLVIPDNKGLQAINLISKKAEYLIDVGEEPFRAAIMGER